MLGQTDYVCSSKPSEETELNISVVLYITFSFLETEFNATIGTEQIFTGCLDLGGWTRDY